MKFFSKLYALAILLGAISVPALAQVDKTPTQTEAPSFYVIPASPTPSASPRAVVTVGPKVAPKAAGIDGVLRIPNVVTFTVFRQYGTIETNVTHNSRVDAGASAIASLIGQTAGTAFNFVALSSDATAVAKGDTTCPSEYVSGGLSRAGATYGSYTGPSTLNGSASFTLTHTWTSTSAGQAINKICALNASSAGTLGFETLLGSTVTLNNGDSGALTWTFNL